MNINILTLSWNGIDKLTKLRNSLIPSLTDLNWTWIIKDNASTDNTVEEVSNWGNNIKVIAYKNNLQNFSQGTNMCFNEAAPKDDDYILLLNNDIIFNDTTSIKNMINHMEKDKKIGAVGARLRYTDTDKLQHAGVVFDTHHKYPLHFRLHETSDQNAEKNRLFQVVTGAVLLTKAEYYKNVCYNPKSGNNGMDENYHWGFDDVDLCLAIYHKMEKKVLYYGHADIYHEDSASLKKKPTNKLFLSHNMATLKNKWEKHYCLDRDIYERDPNFNLYE